MVFHVTKIHFVLSSGYEISVITVDEYLAGTSARVFIDIYGLNHRHTGEIELGERGIFIFKAGA